jgi:hypothetical protein
MMMKKVIYWVVLQILIGFWLIISPHVLGHAGAMSSLDISNVILGATIAFIGIVLAFLSDEVCTPAGHWGKRTV